MFLDHAPGVFEGQNKRMASFAHQAMIAEQNESELIPA
jgi:hypothetical protein